MFRRKKSSADAEQHTTPAINISGPMRITAQAPHAASFQSTSPAPLYERFAKTANPNSSAAMSGQARRTASNVRPRVATDGIEGTARRPEVLQERMGRSGGLSSSRAEPRAGLGISTPSREDVSRVSQHARHQQMSPPTSPTFPRANATPNANPRQMPTVDPHALDDLTPPTSLLTKRSRPLPDPTLVEVSKLNTRREEESTKLTRMLTPPSPPPSSQPSTSVTPSRPMPSPPSSGIPSRPGLKTSPSSTLAQPSPSSPMSDENGALPNSTTLRTSPSLGNSLEAPRAPRRARYSPLAAFGPSVSISTSASSATSSSSVPSAQEVPPPPPPKPRSSVASPTVPTFNIDSSHSAGPGQNLGVEASRPSTDSFSYSDRHASLQPLKTASVELRVGLGADELEAFHSPLFGAGFNTQTNEERAKYDGNGFESRVKQNSRQRVEPNSTRPKNTPAVISSRHRRALQGSDGDGDDGGMEDGRQGKRINARERGRSGRIPSPGSQSVPPEMAAPPTPPSPPAPTPSVLHDSVKVNGESDSVRERSGSVSSTGSLRRKVTVFVKNANEDVPSMPILQPDHHQAPQITLRGQIPTPPTSVDGHSNEQSQRLTIASVLDGQHSSDMPSPSSLESKRIRKTSFAQRAIPESSSPSSSLPSTDELPNGRVRTGDSHADIMSSDMNRRMPFAPSMVASSSTSSADMPYRDETQGKPTPRLQTQNLLAQTQSTHFNHHPSQQLPAPRSPPQSPPQPIAPALSSSQTRSRARSKSRTRSNRPDTGSSVHSQNYVPPSSASSSDGPGRSPSAFSVLNHFSSGSTGGSGHVPRKLTKTPPHSARSMTESMSVAELYQRQITESPEQLDGLVDADPFAKGDIVCPLSSSETASISAGSMVPPVPPFARSQSSGTSSDPPSPASPGDYFSSRVQRRGKRLDGALRETAQALADLHAGMDGEETPRPLALEPVSEGNAQAEVEPEPEPEPAEPTFYPLEKHLMQPELLGALLPYLAFRDWCALIAVNDAMRRKIEHTRELREAVLEYYLRTVGYGRWKWSTKEHIMLTFRDLNSYMRGVSIPSHQYAVHAKAWLDAKQQAQEQPGDEYLKFNLKAATAQKSLLASSCRAYTRVVLRLRAQAEAMERDAEGDEKVYQVTPPPSSSSVNAKPHSHSQAQLQTHARRSMPRARAGTPSRPGSPSASSISHSHHGHYLNGSSNGHDYAKVNRYERAALAGLGPRFRSPLFRLGHAPCLRVCVPNAEGIWLSDGSVLECERELKRAGVVPLLRVGDVVWDTAVGDEGNVGRVVWDGNYLIDLDYTYSRTGEVPQYLHTLSFPPSYFHRVIRTPGNPICHIDISPWGEEIAANLQLLQDRIKTETPQGGHHTVVRWIHRSKFRIRPNPYTNAPIPIPGTSLSVDPGWCGMIIIEIEGTNEGLADLQQRCRSGFPPRAVGGENLNTTNARSTSKVWRLLRERSRPGEIWLRAVREKERLL